MNKSTLSIIAGLLFTAASLFSGISAFMVLGSLFFIIGGSLDIKENYNKKSKL